jgi:predicted HicB family RNase H-like nuclease
MAHEAVEGYLETCAANGIDIPLPISKQKYKGDILIRTTPEMHRRIASESSKQGYKSINRFLIETIKKAVGT